MTQTGIREGTAVWRSYHFRPKDPAWAPSAHLESVRKALADFDWRIALWWSPVRGFGKNPETPGRWRIVEWLPRHGNFDTVFYWEGPSGEYREPNAEAILKSLGGMMADLKQAVAEADHDQAEAKKKRHREWAEAQNEYLADHRERFHGVRQTFAPGYVRRRSVPAAALQDTNHQRWLRDWKKRNGGAA